MWPTDSRSTYAEASGAKSPDGRSPPPEKLQAVGLTEDDSGPAVVATEAAFDAANAALAG